ncbi:Efflux pump alnA [Paramyrothecium foliicola]|nr:Efflux pump alnA [Paramyrothecium foliicola]
MTTDQEKNGNHAESPPAASLDGIAASEETSQPAPEKPPREINGWKWYLAITAILLSIFLYALDNTVVADIQPVIIDEFGHVEMLAWLSVAFLLGASATNLIWGRIYGQFNSKWFYIFNVFLFEVGSAICGAAPNMEAMIVGRAICGVGGAGLYVGCMTLIAQTTSLQERPLYVSATGLTWGIGIVLGPVVGGAFSESAVGWRWAFYINLFIGAVCAPAYLFLIPSIDPRPGVPIKERTTEMDYVGTVLQAAGLTTFVLAINWGGLVHAWNSGTIIGLFVCTGVIFILLGLQQVFTIFTTKERRIITVEFFRSRTVMILFACTAASGACAFVPIYFVPIFFQFTRADGPLDAGVRLLPFIIVVVAFIFINGAFMSKFGYYMPWYLLGGIFTVIGSALMYTVDQTTPTERIYGYTVLIGTGVGMWLQASFSVAPVVVPTAQIGPAIGFLTLAQFLGITIALAIGNTLFLNESQAGIIRILPDVPLEEIQLAMQGAGSRFVQSLSPEARQQVLAVITDSISQTYILVIAGGSLVALLSLLMKREKLFIAGGVHAA